MSTVYTFQVGAITWNYTLTGNNATIGTGITTTYGNATTIGTGLSGAITIPADLSGNPVTAISHSSLRGCNLVTSFTIPNSVTSIAGFAFVQCTGLTSFTIPDSVTFMGNYTWYECTALKSMTIGNSVKSIDSYTFYNCSSLTSVTIGNSVTSIAGAAFQFCSVLTSINIPNSVTSIDSNAFSSTSANLIVAMTTKTISGNVYTSPTPADIAFFGNNSVTLVLPLNMTITSTTPGVTSGSTTKNTFIDLTFTSTASTTDFVVGDISVTNGTLSNFAGIGAVYNAIFTPAGPSACTINVAANKFTSAGQNNTASNIFTWTFDNDNDYGTQQLAGYNFSAALNEQIVRASNLGQGDRFSSGNVAISGNYAIVGSPNEDGSIDQSMDSGAAYIFERDGSGNWIEKKILRASNVGGGDYFGSSVAISGNYAIVGAPYEDNISVDPNFDSGAAYIYERDGSGNWIEKPILRASNLGTGDQFGTSVAISGNYAIVGAFREDGTSISNTTNDCGAAYIFERNGSGVWNQMQILRASNLGATDYFGNSVAISGNYAIVGAISEDGSNTNAEFNCGAAYIFERNGSGVWNQTQILRASNFGINDNFGGSVAISGNYAIVAASQEDGSNTSAEFNSGAAYIFERNDSGNWAEKQILGASNFGQGDSFGIVAIDGNYAVVGVGSEDGSSDNIQGCGAVYIFERNGSGIWNEKQILRASNLDAGDSFGVVAISGNTIMVGAGWEDSSNTYEYYNSGAVYFYSANPLYTLIPTPLWFVNNIITISNAIDATDTDAVSFSLSSGAKLFSFSVTSFSGSGTVSYTLDISGGANVKTGTFNATNADLLAGTHVTASGNTTYILTLTANAAIDYTIVGLLDYGIPSTNIWASPTEKILRASNLGLTDYLGGSVAISGNYAIVGAAYEDGVDNAIGGCGAAYIFELDGSGNWAEKTILRASNLQANDGFGFSVSISGNYAIVGAPYEDGISASEFFSSGAAYIFERDGSGNWIQRPILRASNLGEGDQFGYSVSISGNYAIVGANGEAGPSNGTVQSGAAYIFERNTSTGNWTQNPTILRASNLGGGDRFGQSVAISGNYAIIGAYNEAGASNATLGSGAAYIFELDTSTGNWTEKPILRASNLQADDIFGISVAIDGNYVIVGAYQEDGTNASANFNCGAAYIFERNDSGNWIQNPTILRGSILNLNDWFGFSVSISGNYAIVGAVKVNSNTGAAYIFERNGSGNWAEIKILRASNFGTSDNFGNSVAISGNYAIVGAPYEDSTNTSATFDSGAAYIYAANLTPTPTPLSFVNDRLTIANTIDATDIDVVSFSLTAGSSVYPFSVTSFTGTGTISYRLDISGGANVKTGTFSANNFDLLTGTALTASGNTTYILTLTSNAAIEYTIVGGLLTSPTNIVLSNNSVNELQPIGTTIGTLTCDNPNNSFITYSVSDITRFSIAGSTLKTNVIFDFETTSSYTVTITAAIGGLSSSRSITILVTNISGEAAELRRQNLQGPALKTAADSQGTPITATDLKAAGYNATELKAAVYSATQLKDASFTAAELKDASFTATELKAANYSATELKAANYSAAELKAAAYTLDELITAQYTAADLRAAAYTVAELKAKNFSLAELKSGGYTATEMKSSYLLADLITGGYSVTELKAALFTATELKSANVPLADLISVGYTASELKAALFTATELKSANVPLADLISVGYTASELKAAAYTATELKAAGVSLADLISGGYNATELKAAAYTATELNAAGVSLADLVSGGYSATELKAAAYTATELKAANVPLADLITGGYSVTELKGADYTATELKAAGVPLADLISVGYTASELKAAAFNATELKAALFTATELKAAAFTATELKAAAFNATELKEALFTATELKAALFNATELKEALFNATQLKDALFTATQLKEALFTATELKAAAFTATELKDALFTATELKDALFTATELRLGGFTLAQLQTALFNATELKEALFTAAELKFVGFSLDELIAGSYNATELKAAAFTVAELTSKGFSLASLKTGGYTAAEMKSSFSLDELIAGGYNATELKAAAFTVAELTSKGFSLASLKTGGYTADEMKTSFSLDELIAGGYNATELKAAAFTVAELTSKGFSLASLKAGGYTVAEMVSTFSLAQLKAGGYTVAEMVSTFSLAQLKAGGYTVAEMVSTFTFEQLKAGGYTVPEMTSKFSFAQLKTGGYTATEMKTSFSLNSLITGGYNATELKAAAYTAAELKPKFTLAQLKTGGYTPAEMKAANFSVGQLKSGGYTVAEMTSSYTVAELKSGGYSAVEMSSVYSLDQLIAGGYSAAELKAAAYTVAELKSKGFTIAQLKAGGYTAAEMKSSYTLSELIDGGYSAAELKAAAYSVADLTSRFTLAQLKAGGYTALEMKTSYTLAQLISGGYNAAELRAAAFTVAELKLAGFSLAQLKAGGYTVAEMTSSYTFAELKDGGYSAAQMKSSYSLDQLIAGGYTATELRAADYTVTELTAKGFSFSTLKAGGYSATEMDAVYSLDQLIGGGYSAAELKSAAYSVADLTDKGFSFAALKAGGYSALEMKSTYTLDQLISGGYNATELRAAAYTVADLTVKGFVLTQLKLGGYTVAEMTPTFSFADLKIGGYTAAQMTPTFSLAELISGGYTAAELRDANFSALQLKDAFFTIGELKAGGYTAAQMTPAFSLADLKTAGYTAAELRDANFTALQLKDAAFTIGELKTGGYSAAQMKVALYSASQLKTAGYSVAQMKDAVYSATELNNVGYTSFQLVDGGFNVASLIILDIVPDWNVFENANCITTSYVQDFVDVSGSIILRENANMYINGNVEIDGNVALNRLVVNADANLNRSIFVGGDVSMNGKVTALGDISMNGSVTKCNLNNSSIPKSAFAGTVPDGPNYNTPKIVYDQKFQANADVSMNGPTVASNNVKVSGNIVFNDGTVMNTYDNNVSATNAPAFKASTFSSLDICGNLVAGSYATSSDYRIKTNVVELDETYTVDKLRPVKYFQTQINREKYGLIAHELQEHYPDLVIGEKDGSELQRVNYTGLIAILINDIKRMKRELTELEREI